MNRASEDLTPQQAQAQQGDAGVPRGQDQGSPPIAHAQDHEPQAKHRRQAKQNYRSKYHKFSRIISIELNGSVPKKSLTLINFNALQALSVQLFFRIPRSVLALKQHKSQ